MQMNYWDVYEAKIQVNGIYLYVIIMFLLFL